jgi:ABC-type branched-subunit amino acid transport system substrate-binding protein
MLTQRSALARLLALLVALAMTAVACGGGGTDDASSDDAPADTTAEADEDSEITLTEIDEDDTAAEEPEATTTTVPEEELEPLTASARGVTETEIHVGVTMLDFDALKEFNLVTEGWGNQQMVMQAYIDELNENGGIHGRMVVPHFEYYSPLGSTEAEAVCTALTKDIETFAVLVGFRGPSVEDVNTCVTGANSTAMVGGVVNDERLAQSTAPWVAINADPERQFEAMLAVMAQDGRLADAQIAVVGNLDAEALYDSAPAILEAAGVTPVLEVFNDAPAGDINAVDARWAVIAENIRAAGADTVLVLGSAQGALRGVKDNGLDAEVWAVNTASLENLGAETSPDQADGALTVNALSDSQQWNNPSMQDCKAVALGRISELPDKDPADHASGDERWFKGVLQYCRVLQLFDDLMTEAGRNPTQDSFAAAIEAYGDGSLPAFDFGSLGNGKYDFNDAFQLSQYDASAGADGTLVAISPLYDVTN